MTTRNDGGFVLPHPDGPRRIDVDGRAYRVSSHGDVFVRIPVRPTLNRNMYVSIVERRVRWGGATWRRVNSAYAAALATREKEGRS